MRESVAIDEAAVAKWICDFLAERNSALGPSPSDPDLFASGTVDSLGIVALITGLEARFDMRFSDSAFQDPRFSTIAGVAAIVCEARQRSLG